METTTQQTEKERELWRIAKKRVGFKRHLATYLIVNGMLWCTWYFTETGDRNYEVFPWPLWSMFGWGIGLAFDFMGAYMNNRSSAIEKEYQKLKDKSS